MRAISTLQTFQSLQHYLEFQQWRVFDIENKNLLIRKNSRMSFKCFDFKVHINPGNTWEEWKSAGHCGRVGFFQATFGKFSIKTSTWKFCFSKNQGYTENRIREIHLEAADSVTRSFRRSVSGWVALLFIVSSFDFHLTF